MSQLELYSLIAKYDKTGDGRLDFAGFLGFMTEALQIKPTTEYMQNVKGLFDCVQTNGTVGHEEACYCVNRVKSGNFEVKEERRVERTTTISSQQSSCCLLL